MPFKHLPLIFAFLVLAIAPLAAGPAHAADPAAAQVTSFYAGLTETMKAGPSLGAKGRFHNLAPVIDRAFDLATMTRFAVGSAWSSFSPDQQQETIAAFARLTTASWAHNFASYGGERFEVEPEVQTRGPDKIVQTRLIRAHDTPVTISYRMRESDGAWKIIDVYYGAISQLTTRRSDFAGPIASGGAAGLIAHLDHLVDNLMK